MGRIFIDCFTSLDDLPKKMWGDDMAVLRALSGPQRFSTFEATAGLMTTVKRLEAAGYITMPPSGYPWHNTPLTDAGRAALSHPTNGMTQRG